MVAMDDNFNTRKSMAALFDLIHLTNKNIDDTNFVVQAQKLLVEFQKIFGLDLKASIVEESFSTDFRYTISPDIIKKLIDERNEARRRSDFREADRIRKELEEKNIILEDGKDGETTWRIKK